MQKLTLSAEPEVVDLAKQLARERGISVSEMFSKVVRSMASPTRPARITPRVRRVSGLVKLPEGKSVRELLEEAMIEKHLR